MKAETMKMENPATGKTAYWLRLIEGELKYTMSVGKKTYDEVQKMVENANIEKAKTDKEKK